MTKQDYMDMSGIVYHCDNCKHNDKKWYELPCDYCCPAHSGYEPKDKRAEGVEGADMRGEA